MLSFFGIVLFLLAGADALALLLGWSLTDTAWSPLIFGGLGFLLVALEALERDASRRHAQPAATPRPPVARPHSQLLRSSEG